MYIPTHFKESDVGEFATLIRQFPLALIVSHGEERMETTLLPVLFYPNEGEKGVLRAHFARANPHWKELDSAKECLIVFQGNHGYITPTWYATKEENHKVVPTWNYSAVEVRGYPKIVEDAKWLRRQLDDLTLAQEAGRPREWSIDDAPPDFIEGQMRGIVGVEIEVTQINGKWKMSQNRLPKDRIGVINGLRDVNDKHRNANLAGIIESKHQKL